jgi:hypothetical protein
MVLVVVGLMVVNYRLAEQMPGGNDFLARWTGAHAWLVEGMSPYDEQVSLAAQMQFYGRPADPSSGESLAHFYYPLYSMIFFAPFGLMPFPFARALWMTLLELALPALILMGVRIAEWKPSPAMLVVLMSFSVLWYPGLRAIIVGQFAVFEALLMIGALYAIHLRNDSVAGILIALSTTKPQMAVLLIPLILIWALSRRRWRLILWAAGAQIVLLAVSLALMPNWPILWLRQLIDYAQYTRVSQPAAILASFIPAASRILTLGITALLALYLLSEWALVLHKDGRWFQWTAAITIVLTNIIAFRTATTNFVVMLPAWCIILSEWTKRWKGKGTLASLIALLVLGVGQWVLFLATVSGNDESLVMYLPMPFLTLLGLWWVRWWVIHPQHLLLERT